MIAAPGRPGELARLLGNPGWQIAVVCRSGFGETDYGYVPADGERRTLNQRCLERVCPVGESEGERGAVGTASIGCRRADALRWESDGWQEGLRRDEEPARGRPDAGASEGNHDQASEASRRVRGVRE